MDTLSVVLVLMVDGCLTHDRHMPYCPWAVAWTVRKSRHNYILGESKTIYDKL